MSNIYYYCKQFLEKYLYPLFDVKIYPFEFMDAMYSCDFDFESESESEFLKKEKNNYVKNI